MDKYLFDVKSAYKLFKILIFSGLIYSLLWGCKKSNNSDPVPPLSSSSCRVATTPDGGGATYTYRTDGQFDRIAYRTGDRYEYDYNAKGYIVTLKYILADGSATLTNSYEFVNDRVTKIDTKYVSGSTTTLTFEYDSNGELKRSVYNVLGPTPYTEIIFFANGKQIGHTFQNASGPDSQMYVFENGQVKSSVPDGSGNVGAKYEYDGQGHRIREESLVSGRVVFYTVYEYTEGKAVQEAMPSLKGFPKDWHQGVNMGNYGLPVKITEYNTSGVGSMYVSREAIYSYLKNANGFPLEQTFTSKRYNSKGEVTGLGDGVSTYTYVNCP